MNRPLLAVVMVVALAACMAPGVVLAQEEKASPATAPASVELLDAPKSETGGALAEAWMWMKVKWGLGGLTMYLLAFVCLVGVVFAIDRVVTLRRGRIVPKGLADQANRLWQQGQYAQIVQLTRRSDSTLARVMRFMVEHRSNAYDSINKGAEDIAGRDFEVHTRRNYPLGAVGTIAPLMGLLGTVSGLLGAFATIGVVGSMDDPAALAGNIGEALITTFVGLFIAIPTLGLYHYFRSRTGQFASILGEEISNLMHAWFLKKERDDARQA